jgi:hypothetical protein
MEMFWGRTATFWGAIEALGVCANTVFVVATLLFIYRQVRTAAKSFQLDVICRMQALVDDFRDDRIALFANVPLELVASREQFPQQAPGRRLSAEYAGVWNPTSEQALALTSIADDVRDRAIRVIARMNDLWQLVEDGIIDRRTFLGKYHVMVIQCCHLVEAVRRAEEARRGGNYGQRLLRMRQAAIMFNDASPKHRAVTIKVSRLHPTRYVLGGDKREHSVPSIPEERVIYQSPRPTFARRLRWALRRWFS